VRGFKIIKESISENNILMLLKRQNRSRELGRGAKHDCFNTKKYNPTNQELLSESLATRIEKRNTRFMLPNKLIVDIYSFTFLRKRTTTVDFVRELIVLGAHRLCVLGRLGPMCVGGGQPLTYKYVLMSFELIEQPFSPGKMASEPGFPPTHPHLKP
jgi:hypothetical protein